MELGGFGLVFLLLCLGWFVWFNLSVKGEVVSLRNAFVPLHGEFRPLKVSLTSRAFKVESDLPIWLSVHQQISLTGTFSCFLSTATCSLFCPGLFSLTKLVIIRKFSLV